MIETTKLRLSVSLLRLYCICVIESNSLIYYGWKIKVASSNLPVHIKASPLKQLPGAALIEATILKLTCLVKAALLLSH